MAITATIVWTDVGKLLDNRRAGGVYAGTPEPEPPEYMAWGIGADNPSKFDTELVTEIQRVFAPPVLADASTLQWVGTFTNIASNVLREIGIFNDTTAGTLYMRAKVFTDGKVGYRLYTGDDIEITMSLEKT